jgi:hypothetical protein
MSCYEVATWLRCLIMCCNLASMTRHGACPCQHSCICYLQMMVCDAQEPVCRPLVAANGGGAAAAEGLAPANGTLHLDTSARSSPKEPRGAAGNAEFYSPTSSLNRWVQRTIRGCDVRAYTGAPTVAGVAADSFVPCFAISSDCDMVECSLRQGCCFIMQPDVRVWGAVDSQAEAGPTAVQTCSAEGGLRGRGSCSGARHTCRSAR